MNGRIVDEGRGVVPAADRGFLFADGVFETMLVHRRRVFRLTEHLSRLAAGARRLGIPVRRDVKSAVETLLQRAAAAGALSDRDAERGALRVTLTRGPGADGLLPPAEPDPTLVISIRSLPVFPPEWRTRGISLATSSSRVSARSSTAGLKTVAYLPNILALVDARASGADDALLLNEEGHVVQASASNLFWVSPQGQLCTPSARCGILPGITRAVVRDLAARSGYEVIEAEWPLSELAGATEAFMTSSLRGLMPATSLDGAPIGSGQVGSLTSDLVATYDELVERETT